MPLRIVSESDPIQISQLVSTIYSDPGIGKTSLGFTCDNPILLDFDKGAHRARNRKDSVPIRRWEDVLDITPEDLAPYKTVVIDTPGRALEFLTLSLIDEDPKLGKNGKLTISGFGVLRTAFTGWLNQLKSFGLDVVMACHAEEKSKGDDTIYRLDITGGSKGEIYKSSDMMGRLYIENGKRYLNFSPTDVSFGKDPGQLGVIEVPDYSKDPNFFGGILRRVKAAINSQTPAQKEASQLLETWRLKADEALTIDDFKGLREDLKEVECSDFVRNTVWRMIVDAAEPRGYTFDKRKKEFVKAVAA